MRKMEWYETLGWGLLIVMILLMIFRILKVI